jgi:ankyrin repeat protein
MSTHTELAHKAAEIGDVVELERLIALDQNVIYEFYNFSLMYTAIMNGHTQIVELLLKTDRSLANKPIDKWGGIPMRKATQLGKKEIVELFVAYGAVIDERSPNGSTAMHSAWRRGYIDIVELFVKSGSTAYMAHAIYKDSPMHWMVWCDSIIIKDLIIMFVKLGSDLIDSLDHFGNTPLHNACYDLDNRIVMLEIFLQCGSRAIDIKNNEGDTPVSCIYKQNFVSDECKKMFLMLDGSEQCVREYHAYCAATNQAVISWTKDEAFEVRHRIYFNQSLVHRLLLLGYRDT